MHSWIGPSSVSMALASAAAKVGLRAQHALVDIATAMFGVRSSDTQIATLTPADRDVLELDEPAAPFMDC